MAWDIAYASVEQYKAERKQTGTTTTEGVERDLRAISRIIDKRTGRRFGKSDTTEIRTYYAAGQSRVPRTWGMRPAGWAESENPWRYEGIVRILSIDDLWSTTGLRMVVDDNRDGSFTGDPDLDLSQFDFIPLNAQVDGKPYTDVMVPDWSQFGGFANGRKILVESPNWGWAEVPEAIQRGAIDLCQILRLESPRATRTMTDLNQVLSVTPAANNILSELIRDYSRKTGLFDR